MPFKFKVIFTQERSNLSILINYVSKKNVLKISIF